MSSLLIYFTHSSLYVLTPYWHLAPPHSPLINTNLSSISVGLLFCCCYCCYSHTVQYSVQLFSHVRLFATPWIAACQSFLSIINSRSLVKLMSIESVMPSNHLILCRPLSLPPSIIPSIRVFSNESVFRIMWPKFDVPASASVLPMNIQDWFPLGWTGWISFLSKGCSRVFSNTTIQKHQFFGAQLSLQSNSHIYLYMTTGKTIALTRWTFVNSLLQNKILFWLTRRHVQILFILPIVIVFSNQLPHFFRAFYFYPTKLTIKDNL